MQAANVPGLGSGCLPLGVGDRVSVLGQIVACGAARHLGRRGGQLSRRLTRPPVNDRLRTGTIQGNPTV